MSIVAIALRGVLTVSCCIVSVFEGVLEKMGVIVFYISMTDQLTIFFYKAKIVLLKCAD